ncbi:DUF6092 family protein [Actinomadura fibrosa]|uniref:DUF6092 family protein n=1 Tax=Actinomadura fibrosa TaxID=111802 RepID=A0ABW2XYY1_9ACTN|nr:DUF6092 family protein [Actinomadura fibrosa]
MSPGSPPPVRVGEELLLLAAYLLSSGRGLVEEPPQYGPLRCLDAARRLLELAARTGVDHAGIASVRARLDDVMRGAMAERDMGALLDGACLELALVLAGSDLISGGAD